MLREQIVEPISRNIEAFAKTVFDSMSGFALTMLGAFVGIWLILVAWKAMVEGEFNLPEVIKKVLMISVMGSLLTVNNSIFYEYIYTPIKDTTNALVGNVLSISPSINGKKLNSAEEAVDSLEWSFKEIVEFIWKVLEKAGPFALVGAGLVGVLLTFIFTLSEMIYALYLLGNTMKLAAVGALSPLLIVAFAFERTRGYALGALRYLLSSSLTLIIASFSVGMLLFVLRKFLASVNLQTVNTQDVFNMLNGMLVLACLSAYFLLLAPGVASAIAGSQSETGLTATAAAFMSGGLTLISPKPGYAPLIKLGSAASSVMNKLFNQIYNNSTTVGETKSKIAANYNPGQNRSP